MTVIVVATHNAKKAAELHRVLAASGVDAEVKGLDEFPPYPDRPPKLRRPSRAMH